MRVFLQNRIILALASSLLLNSYRICFNSQPECSVLLDALEQSSCNPEITGSIAKCLFRIYLASAEKTAASFKTLDAIPRVLKVACIQVYESKRRREFGNSTSEEIVQSWHASLELFRKYFSATEDSRNLILHSSSCVDCLFDLFWEEKLRDRVLVYILDLMKVCSFDSFVMFVFCDLNIGLDPSL